MGRYRAGAGLQLREDLRVDHVQLRLDLVAADVVDGGHVFVQDQMFRRGRKPGQAKRTVPSAPVSTKVKAWTVKPVHPGPVLLRLQDALWDDVDHQRRGVLGASRLVPGPDGPLGTGLGSDPSARTSHLLSCSLEDTASTKASDGHSTTRKAGPGSVGVHTCSGRIWRSTGSADRSQSGSRSEKSDRQHLSALVGDAPAVLQRGDERPDGGGAPGGGETALDRWRGSSADV